MDTSQVAPEADELEALFDSISADRQQEIARLHGGASALVDDAPVERAGTTPPIKPAPEADAAAMYARVGQLTRQLHTAIRELGYDKAIEKAALDIPDARDRLSYVSRLTGQAAERTLSAVEIGQSEQQQLHDQAAGLAKSWEKFLQADMRLDEFKSLAQEMRGFLVSTQARAVATQHQLSEIMMAQDFHDLTGQVINKLTGLTEGIERELIGFLLDGLPSERRQELSDELEGPVVKSAGRGDVVTNQGQVDDLLESLGF